MNRHLLPILIAGLLLPGCKRHEPPKTEGLLYVSEIVAPPVATAGEFFSVEIVGTKPDPAWAWAYNEVATESGTVILTIHGVRNPQTVAAQVLTEYRAPQRIRKLKPGALTIVAKGRNGAISRTIEVATPSRGPS